LLEQALQDQYFSYQLFRVSFVLNTRKPEMYVIENILEQNIPCNPSNARPAPEITNSMELITTREATSREASREFPSILCNLKVHYRIHKFPLMHVLLQKLLTPWS
jgi:hypothetical protein